ncbi:hypothetical protein JCM1840_006809 [Sporobolomyces johnsonii]
MGISGLLPLLKEIATPTHVKEWSGKTLAVDAYVWLHRGAYGCAEELATGKPTIKYVNYAMHRVRMLKYYGVTPFIVFDGGLLPSKMGTEDEREKRRSDALAKGNVFLAEGKTSQARECFVKAIDVTPAMAYQLIKALRREGIQYVVAPYEADPQLAYLERRGLVDGIITEDSDLLVFGCQNVLFKLDGEGNCVSIARKDFAKCREYDFAGWSDTEFRQMAILSGCDYIESIVGLGLKTAYRLMRKYKTAEKVVQFVRLGGQLKVPRNYLDEFRRAELTFLYQRVFDPVDRQLVHFSPLPQGMNADEMPFVGAPLEEEYACDLADGNIDPITKERMVDLMPDVASPAKSYKPDSFQPTAAASSSSRSKPKPAPAQPAKGASSLLSFFTRSAHVASASSPVNPVKVVANNRRVQLLDAGKGKENAQRAASPKRTSKFFGGGGGTSASLDKGKGMEGEVDVEPEVEGEQGEPHLVGDEDDDAEAALRDVEVTAIVTTTITTAAVQVGSDKGVITDVTNQSRDNGTGRLPADLPNSAREASVSCISSPISTPPRKRIKLWHPQQDEPAQRLPAVAEAGETAIDDLEDAQHSISEALITDISSPAESVRADAGWDEPDVSSPVAEPRSTSRVKVEAEQKPVVNKVAKHGAPMKQSGKKSGYIELSSDPIVLSSDAPEEERTPRPSTSARRPKPAAKSPLGETKPKLERERKKGGPRVSQDASAEKQTGSAKSKGKKRPKVEHEEEEVDPVVQSVAASWRARFMMQSASKTPTPKTAISHSRLPTPTTSSRPPSVEQQPASSSSPNKKKPAAACKSTTPASAAARRIPLSPRSTNRIAKQPLGDVGAPPPLKLAATEAPSSSSPQKRRKPSPASDSSDRGMPLHAGTSSSPVVVTNPRLLAFRFTGTVHRD